MRPVQKYTIGSTLADGVTIVESNYSPYTKAHPVLIENLGNYCNYCEAFHTDLEVEHVVSKNQDSSLKTSWDNFLLSCGRCNGIDNKTNKPVDTNLLYFPHLHNTFFALKYEEGGLVVVNHSLTPTQQGKALATIKLLGLDKYPENPDYNDRKYPQGFSSADQRWEFRRQAWEKADKILAKYENGEIGLQNIIDFSTQRGYFSIWMSVFQDHPEVRQGLIDAYKNTAANCFNSATEPIPRSPGNTVDTV